MNTFRLGRIILLMIAALTGVSLAVSAVQAAALHPSRGSSAGPFTLPLVELSSTNQTTSTLAAALEITASIPVTTAELTPVPTGTLTTAPLTTTLTLTPTADATPVPVEIYAVSVITGNLKAYLPLITYNPEKLVEKHLICSGYTGISIPDDSDAGVSHTIHGWDKWFVVDMDVYLNIDHEWVGDTTAWLTHVDTGKIVSLFDRPGRTSSDQLGCSQDNIRAIFDDQASITAEDKCGGVAPSYGVVVPAVGGTFIPHKYLSNFINDSFAGQWKLTVFDEEYGSTGRLNEWCMEVTLSNYRSDPPVVPVIPSLPASAYVSGMWGDYQHLPLDCESRSAVDWARHFGVEIGEYEFFYGLPVTDNPDTGFVGSVYGTWGQTPPNAYGVHAEPIAKRLRQFGLDATAVRKMSWDELRYEIAHGRPVEVWVIGGAASGWPLYYKASDGSTTVVAPYEHSVIVTGYDTQNVRILNGAAFVDIPIRRFLDSWGVLRNMAVIGK